MGVWLHTSHNQILLYSSIFHNVYSLLYREIETLYIEYIVHNGMMKDLSVLQESPFTDRGSIVEVFQDLSVWMGIRKVIETINHNAAA